MEKEKIINKIGINISKYYIVFVIFSFLILTIMAFINPLITNGNLFETIASKVESFAKFIPNSETFLESLSKLETIINNGGIILLMISLFIIFIIHLLLVISSLIIIGMKNIFKNPIKLSTLIILSLNAIILINYLLKILNNGYIYIFIANDSIGYMLFLINLILVIILLLCYVAKFIIYFKQNGFEKVTNVLLIVISILIGLSFLNKLTFYMSVLIINSNIDYYSLIIDNFNLIDNLAKSLKIDTKQLSFIEASRPQINNFLSVYFVSIINRFLLSNLMYSLFMFISSLFVCVIKFNNIIVKKYITDIILILSGLILLMTFNGLIFVCALVLIFLIVFKYLNFLLKKERNE